MNGPQVGDQVRFSRTIAECDVYGFAGLTGDFSSVHMDEVVMQSSVYGRRIAHGAMLIGFMSAASTLLVGRVSRPDGPETLVSLGYDRIRFTAPVFMGDTITVTYRIGDLDLVRRRFKGDVTVTNEHGVVVAVATNILAWTGGGNATQHD